MRTNEVFTPGSLPTYTYCTRKDLNLEKSLQEGIKTTGFICSISGPSKSGKTVLCESVIKKSDMLLVAGGGVSSESVFWQRLRSKLDLPTTLTSKNVSSTSTEVKSDLSGNIQIPLVAKGEGKIGGSLGESTENAVSATYDGRNGVGLLEFIRDKNLILVVDDFHYIDRAVQKSLAQQFKEAARAGCTIVVISVSHRADDAIRVNPDLRGRVFSIDIPFWKWKELKDIAFKGFPLLNMKLKETLVETLAEESICSPQLMQLLCLQICNKLNINEMLKEKKTISLKQQQIINLLKATTSIVNCRTSLDIIVGGAKTRGSKRKEHTLNTGRSGDIYYILLKAIAGLDANKSYHLQAIKDRIDDLHPTDPPSGVRIMRTLEQMYKTVLEKLGEDRVLEWDNEKETLNILDPYFLYYLRWAEW
jgi:hypothetical protein